MNDLIDMGICPFCSENVFVEEGTLVRHMNGDPTHDQCRKDMGINDEWL